jgi:hypothetical protein
MRANVFFTTGHWVRRSNTLRLSIHFLLSHGADLPFWACSLLDPKARSFFRAGHVATEVPQAEIEMKLFRDLSLFRTS